MNKIIEKYDNVDYRVLSIESCKDEYDKFTKELQDRRRCGLNNEYEVFGDTIDSISIKCGFQAITAIVLFIPYMTEEKMKLSKKSNLSSHACSMDYHLIAKNLMSNIVMDLKNEYPENNYYIQCDNGPYNERFFAIKSGLGKKSINSTIINDIYGSYGFIGLIITDAMIKEYKTQEKHCNHCGECIKKCPSKAISSEGIDFNRCISYLTQKKKLSESEEQLLKSQNKIFGCDVCQEVCPENKNKKYSNIEDFKRDLLYNIELEDIEYLSNREFKRKFSDRNFSWKGKNIIARNISIGRGK